MKSKVVYLIASLVLLLSACGEDNASYLWPTSTGRPGGLTLVVDDNKWKSPVGDSLKELFNREVFGLPQPEPMFDLDVVPNAAFNNLFQKNRNIVRVRITPQNKENAIKVKHNMWAKPQIYVEIKAKSDSDFHSMFSAYKENILDSLILADKQNYVEGFKKFNSGEVKMQLQKRGLDLHVPMGFVVKKAKKDFLWIAHENTILKQNLVIFSYPYVDTAQFHKDILIHQIDSALKINVPGPIKKSYAQIEKAIDPEYTKYLTNNNFTVELRGLWATEGYPMGGSFVATAIPEVQRNRITVLMGFVFAPKVTKRNYQRQLEAIMSTIRFVGVPIE